MTDTQPPTSPAPPASTAEATSQPSKPAPSHLGRFFQSALRWITGIAVVFALGLLTAWFVQVRPLTERQQVLQSELENATKKVADLTTEVESLRPLQTQVVDLQAKLSRSQNQSLILQALVNVTSAQVALALSSPANAQQALSGTDALLGQLQSELPSDQVSVLREARDRLKLATSEIGSNNFAAKNDLEVLASLLASLKEAVVKGP